jgi:septum site-determining protein MinC
MEGVSPSTPPTEPQSSSEEIPFGKPPFEHPPEDLLANPLLPDLPDFEIPDLDISGLFNTALPNAVNIADAVNIPDASTPSVAATPRVAAVPPVVPPVELPVALPVVPPKIEAPAPVNPTSADATSAIVPAAPARELTAPPEAPPVDPRQMVRWQTETDKISLHLPAEITGGLSLHELWLQIQLRLQAGERFWQPHTPVDLHVGRRLLDQRQLQDLAELLGVAQLALKRVHTLRRQTAIAAATAGYAVEQEPVVAPLAMTGPSSTLPFNEPLYLETTLRSGTEICHPGSVIVVGDLNPGSSIVADGNILVWGRLRGIAHAGAQGNQTCRIMALQMEATQLRIADQIARTPKPPAESYPEVAYITPEGIRLARANLKKID